MNEVLEVTGVRKAAILLVQLGQQRASALLKHMSPTEVEAISTEIARLGPLEPAEAEAVLAEFHSVAAANAALIQGGPSFALALLEESLGPERARAVMSRITGNNARQPFRCLRGIEGRQLLTLLSREHPQVIAVVLAYVPTDKATFVLAGLEPELQADVAHRIAVMERPAADVIRRLESSLEHTLATVAEASDTLAVSGIEPLVEIINRSDRATERMILESLEARDPELAEQVRGRMFTFEDIVSLEDRALQLVLRKVENGDLALALKGVGEDVRSKITSNMSERAAVTLLEDVELLGAVRRKQVEEAQQKIIAAVRELESAGEITLRRGADDEYVV